MSTIKVDTYLTRGGASEIAIDKLKGASSASSMSVVGEGGTTTTNLQQGLAKVWIHFPGDGASINDSLNVSSLTDTATGNAFVAINNNMNNSTYSYVNGNQFTTATGGNAFFANAGAQATTGYDVTHYQNGALADSVKASSTAHGDLA